jgi:hypothetical protein
MHFAVGTMALIKSITKIQTHSEIIISSTLDYSVFAILFGYVFRTNPSNIAKKE